MSGWLPGFLLALVPLFLLIGLLVHGRYPGEAALDRLRQVVIRLGRIPRSRKVLDAPVPVFPPRLGGGRLIACSLAGRGPPFTSEVRSDFRM